MKFLFRVSGGSNIPFASHEAEVVYFMPTAGEVSWIGVGADLNAESKGLPADGIFVTLEDEPEEIWEVNTGEVSLLVCAEHPPEPPHGKLIWHKEE